MRSDQVVAIILAAGQSSRMGVSKALLPLGRATFLESILKLYSEAVTNRVVVLGKNHREVESRVDLQGVTVVHNSRPELGPLSSLRLALQKFRDASALIAHPVDHPFVEPSTVDLILRAHHRSRGSIVIPEHQGRKGHPVLFPFRFYPDLLGAPLDQGARWVVRENPAMVLHVVVDDSGITKNLNTRQEYLEATGFPKLGGRPRLQSSD